MITMLLILYGDSIDGITSFIFITIALFNRFSIVYSINNKIHLICITYNNNQNNN
ncbi:hypothetical protein BDB01DRAFT_829505, partial [Pilobolus umbonatus]